MKSMRLMIATGISTLFATGAMAAADATVTFSDGLRAEATWEKGPVVGSESILRLDFGVMLQDGFLPKALLDSPKVELFMPAMGHGSSPTKVSPVLSPAGEVKIGTYRVNRVQFIMEGPWEVRIRILKADGTWETQAFELEVN